MLRHALILLALAPLTASSLARADGPSSTPAPSVPPSSSLPSPIPSRRPPLWPALSAGTLAILAVGIGAGLTVAANGRASDVALLQLPSLSGCVVPGTNAVRCLALHDAASGQVALSEAAVGAFVTGGALALVAAGLGVWALRGPTPVHVAPLVGSGHAGLVIGGAW